MSILSFAELQVFVAVARERSFSRAAAKLHRTQPAVSQAIRRLEEQLGERLFDRTSKDGTLTDAGQVLLDYAERLLRLSEETAAAVVELRDLRRGCVRIGSNEAGVHALLPIIARFREVHPGIRVDVRRLAARQIGVEVLQRTLDCGVVTFSPAERGLETIVVDQDELVMLVHPEHSLSRRRQITSRELGEQVVIAHSDPSPVRDQVIRRYEERHESLNIELSLPSLDAIKRAVEMRLGVALLPRRCALAELASGRLVAVPVRQLRLRRQVRLVYRAGGGLSRAAAAFLDVARQVRQVQAKGEGSPA